MQISHGSFVAICGTSGTGKDSQIAALRNTFGLGNTLEFDDSAGFKKIRSEARGFGAGQPDKPANTDRYSMAMLSIIPRMRMSGSIDAYTRAGQMVLSNRSCIDTGVYQLGADPDLFRNYLDLYFEYGCRPLDAVLVLETSPEISMTRIIKRGLPLSNNETLEKIAKNQQQFRNVAFQYGEYLGQTKKQEVGVAIIDSTPPETQVTKSILLAMSGWGLAQLNRT